MSTPREIPGARPQVAVDMASPLTLSVAEDLAVIFPHEPRPLTETALQLASRRDALTTAPRPTQGRRAGALGAIAAAALLGVVAGAMIGHEPLPAPRDQQPVVQASAEPGPTSAPAARPPSPQPPVQAARTEAETPAPARLRRVVARPAAAHPRRATKVHLISTCRAPHCHAPSVTADDEGRLRRAYDSAADAGVSQNVLADYHQQWERLRRQAPDEPGEVAARYHQLTGELDSMAAGRLRSDRVAPERPTAWLEGRTQVAELGR